jgi:ABC-2 type transport system permease protein
VRDLFRFAQERSRWLGAVLQPLIFWAMMGFGMGDSFQLKSNTGSAAALAPSASGYAAYFFPGSLVLVALFTAMFASMSIIEDRNEGFLQALLVRPKARLGILLGKTGSIVGLTLLQAALFMLASPLAGVSLASINPLLLILVILFGTAGLCLLSLASAWKLNSIAGYHSIMALILFPLWIFSGAFFPMDSGWKLLVARCNPLAYFVDGVRFSVGGSPVGVPLESSLAALAVLGFIICYRTLSATKLSAQ